LLSILIIANNHIRGTIIQSGLELSGYHPAQLFNTLEEASNAIKLHQPTLMIYFRPVDENARQFCQTVQADYNIPIVSIGESAITADASLPFPYQFQNLLDTVQRFIPLPTEFFRADRQYFASQQEEEAKYRDLFDRASEAILLIDYDTHIIIDANNQAVKLYGYSLEELVGMSLLQIVPEGQHSSVLENAHNLKTEQTVLRIDNRTHIKKDRESLSVSISAGLIEYGGRTVFQDIIRDETERLQQEAELKRLNQIKDEFVSNISHELKTPLTSLHIRLHMLSRQPEQLEHHATVLEREVDRLDGLIENLLILSRLDQGRQAIDFTEINLNDVMQEYYEDRTPLADENNLSLVCNLMPNLSLVNASRDLLGQVLSIFLTNAFNYTPSGGVVTITTLETIIDSKSWIGLSVHDTGLGILPDEQQSLFTRFFRGRVGQASTKSGTGLGLAIAKEIIAHHDGRIYVESDGIPGNGATFGVWLPL
jgi:PAS domain S-box-containing protein